jgi:threonine dehydrogenase-like Zn-dependent dehydrogenase
VRAVVIDERGTPVPTEIAEPTGSVPVLACGLCGSDVEKLTPDHAGAVLGHEVVTRVDGRRVAAFHHLPCGECVRCLAGHESTCERFQAETIVPGGFAERVHAAGWVGLPDDLPDAVGTYVEPLACVLRSAERLPHGRVLVVGGGFVGKLFAAVLRHRGDTAFVADLDPTRDGPRPDGPVDGAVLCAEGGADEAAAALDPGGTLLVFASAGALDLDAVYRRELHVVGSRSATPRHMEQAAALLPELDVPEPTVLPLERFAEGLDLYLRRQALKVVFTP